MKKVAISALSSGLGMIYPHMIDLAIDNYKKYFNLECVKLDTCEMSFKDVKDNPHIRAKELNNALNREYTLINSLIGGNDSIRILEYIDISAKDNRVMGFSDATQYLSYLATHGKKAIYGPSILAGMAQLHNLPSSHVNMLKEVLFTECDVIYPIYDWYAFEYEDWAELDNNGKLKEIYSTNGVKICNSEGKGIIEGKLWGGCMESIEQMKQTRYYPSKEYLKDKIIFFETSEERPSIELLCRWIYNYCISGTLEEVTAIMFGIFGHFNEEESKIARKSIKEIIVDEYNINIPLIFNCPIGHTTPAWALPYNEVMQIDTDNIKFTLKRS